MQGMTATKKRRMANEHVSKNGISTELETEWERQYGAECWREVAASLPSVVERKEWDNCRHEMIAVLFTYRLIRTGLTSVLTFQRLHKRVRRSRVSHSDNTLKGKVKLCTSAYSIISKNKEYQSVLARGLRAMGGVPTRNRTYANVIKGERDIPWRKIPIEELVTELGEKYRETKRTASGLAIIFTSFEEVGWRFDDYPYPWNDLRDIIELAEDASMLDYDRAVTKLMWWLPRLFSRESNGRPSSETELYYATTEAVPLSRLHKFVKYFLRITSYVDWHNDTQPGLPLIRCARKLTLGIPMPKKNQVTEWYVRDYVFNTAPTPTTDQGREGTAEMVGALQIEEDAVDRARDGSGQGGNSGPPSVIDTAELVEDCAQRLTPVQLLTLAAALQEKARQQQQAVSALPVARPWLFPVLHTTDNEESTGSAERKADSPPE
jgi:hypothetical protein